MLFKLLNYHLSINYGYIAFPYALLPFFWFIAPFSKWQPSYLPDGSTGVDRFWVVHRRWWKNIPRKMCREGQRKNVILYIPMDPWPLSEKVRLTLQIITQTLPKKVLGSIGIDINWFRGVNHDIMISWIWLNCYIITIVWPLHHHYIKCCWTHGSIFIYTNVVNLLQFNIAIDIMVILNVYCNITIISIAIRYIHYIDI